jgi:hypothetical protein
MASSPSTCLNVTLAHAISYLTRPLIRSYPPTTVVKLQLVLEANLTALFAPTWLPKDPSRGSDRRCLTLSPKCLPPRAIYSACLATGVQWFDWIALLGGREFDFFVDPASVSVAFGPRGTPSVTVWSDEVSISPSQFHPEPTRMQSQFLAQVEATAKAQHRYHSKSLAQQLVEVDKEEDEELFAMLADEISAPTWMTPVRDQFPITARPSSPISAISTHSRSSSRSSNSSSGLSFSSSDSYSSANTVSTPASSPVSQGSSQCKQSRRERARQARVFIDASKTEVTPYDGGKTTVLTGGVMLGGPPTAKKVASKPTQSTMTSSPAWRTVHV